MKSYPVIFILTVLLFTANLISGQRNAGYTDQNTAKALQITLKTGKDTFAVGDEIHFTIGFKNVSPHLLRILLDQEFVGSNMVCMDVEGNRYTFEGGYLSWSPKAGVFTGRTWLIPPDSTLEVKLDALVYDHYSLIFSNKFDRKGKNDFQDVKRRHNLPEDFPDKYIAAGRIFTLPATGNYRLTYLYEATGNDKTWRFSGAKTPEEASTENLWTGTVSSNTILLFIR